MFHSFRQSDSKQYQTLNQKLQSAISYLSLHNPQTSILEVPFTETVRIIQSIYSPKHCSQLLVLSNSRILRYDFETEQMGELKGIDNMQIVDVQILEIGEVEKYLFFTQQSIFICSLISLHKTKICFRIDQSNQKPYHSHNKQQKVINLNGNQSFDLIEPSNSSLAISQFESLASNKFDFKLESIFCYIEKQQFRQLFAQAEQVESKHSGSPLSSKLQFQQMHIVKKSIDYRKQRLMNLVSNEAFICLIYQQIANKNYGIIAYRFSIQYEEVLISQGTIYKLQNYSLQPIVFFDQKSPVILAFTSLNVSLLNHQHKSIISPTQLSQSNAQNIKRNLFVSCDQHSSPIEDRFSLYFTTRTIINEMNPLDFRHCVFQFQFLIEGVFFKQTKSDTCTIYELASKKVLCPARVYSLPINEVSSLLRFINISKIYEALELEPQVFHIEQTTFPERDKAYIAKNITLNLLYTLPSGKLEVCQFRLTIDRGKIETEEKPQRKYQFDKQNSLLYLKIEQSLLLNQMLLFDPVNQYMIALVDKGQVQISKSLLNQLYLASNFNQFQHKIIAVIDLRQSTDPKRRIISEYNLPVKFSDLLCSIQVYKLLNQFSEHQCPVESIDTDKRVQRKSIGLKKFVQLVDLKANLLESVGRFNQEIAIIQVKLIPKLQLYEAMLKRLVSYKKEQEKEEMHQKNQKIQQQKSCDILFESFSRTTLKLLQI